MIDSSLTSYLISDRNSTLSFLFSICSHSPIVISCHRRSWCLPHLESYTHLFTYLDRRHEWIKTPAFLVSAQWGYRWNHQRNTAWRYVQRITVSPHAPSRHPHSSRCIVRLTSIVALLAENHYGKQIFSPASFTALWMIFGILLGIVSGRWKLSALCVFAFNGA
jgi:hypothetical protein